MKYRKVGGTDLAVSEIGFGCGGNAGLMVRGSFDEQLAVVERALDLGITLIDTAEIYGRGESERIVGKFLDGRRNEAFVATKVLPVAPTAKYVEKHGRASAAVIAPLPAPISTTNSPAVTPADSTKRSASSGRRKFCPRRRRRSSRGDRRPAGTDHHHAIHAGSLTRTGLAHNRVWSSRSHLRSATSELTKRSGLNAHLLGA